MSKIESGEGGIDFPVKMEVGKFYDFDPPARVPKGVFRRAQCIGTVPGHPNEFLMDGIPEGGSEIKGFVLQFREKGVRTSLANEQNFDYDPDVVN